MLPLLLSFACLIDLDQDQDGVPIGQDCDDNDPLVGDQAETCDDGGRDRDCSGDPDDAQVAWWPDVDGDGFGASDDQVPGDCAGPNVVVPGVTLVRGEWPELSLQAQAGDALLWCQREEAVVQVDTLDAGATCWSNRTVQAAAADCNDRDRSVHPGADEGCDASDRDCDQIPGQDDPDGRAQWYTDGDGDEAGDPKAPGDVGECDPDDGWALTDTDCDDVHEPVGPRAESCDDGYRNACGARYDFELDMQRACGGCHSADLLLDETWVTAGELDASPAWTDLDTVHDEALPEGAVTALRAWIEDGAPTTGGALEVCDRTPESVGALGYARYTPGGVEEVMLATGLVLAPTGTAYVSVYGAQWAAVPDAFAATHELWASEPVSVDGTHAAWDPASAGLVVGEPGTVTQYDADLAETDGWTDLGDLGDLVAADATTLLTAGPGGVAVLQPGDVVGAAMPLPAGACATPSALVVQGPWALVGVTALGNCETNGHVTVAHVSGSTVTEAQTWTGLFGLGDAGAALALGDVDGDGATDALIGAPGTVQSHTGHAYLLLTLDDWATAGTSLRDADRTLSGANPGDQAGAAVLLEDLDGDGYDDAVIGSPSHDQGRGAVAVIPGPVIHGLHDAPIWLPGTTRDGRFGATLASAQLTDADEGPPSLLLVGAPGADAGEGRFVPVEGWRP